MAMRAAASHAPATHARATWSAGGSPNPWRAPPPLVRVPRRAARRGWLCGCRRAALAVGLGRPAASPSGFHAEERGSTQRSRALAGMGDMGDAEDGDGLAALDDKTLRELRRLEGLAEPILELRSSARGESLKVRCVCCVCCVLCGCERESRTLHVHAVHALSVPS